MRKLYVPLVLVALMLMMGCASYHGADSPRKEPCPEPESDRVLLEEVIDEVKASKQTLASIWLEQHGYNKPCHLKHLKPCPDREKPREAIDLETTRLVPKRELEISPPAEPKKEPIKVARYGKEDKGWVFRYESDGDEIKIITNANLIREPRSGETVYWVGDHQGWFSRQWPMVREGDTYMVKIPTSRFQGRNRANFVILNEGPVHSVDDWAIFDPGNDPMWVRQGDLTPSGNYAYCIMFNLSADGTVSPTD